MKKTLFLIVLNILMASLLALPAAAGEYDLKTNQELEEIETVLNNGSQLNHYIRYERYSSEYENFLDYNYKRFEHLIRKGKRRAYIGLGLMTVSAGLGIGLAISNSPDAPSDLDEDELDDYNANQKFINGCFGLAIASTGIAGLIIALAGYSQLEIGKQSIKKLDTLKATKKTIALKSIGISTFSKTTSFSMIFEF